MESSEAQKLLVPKKVESGFRVLKIQRCMLEMERANARNQRAALNRAQNLLSPGKTEQSREAYSRNMLNVRRSYQMWTSIYWNSVLALNHQFN